ncbi:hypothetical protein [Oceanispirochaeta sp.]|jgi:hypothetical protein|uniref:hypothetical protein n=1 Tax=Oceanispirochaeta sp. TaxID=2035350 RepID=UPI00260B330B|nr:hypothetical protein [Oceanispirochaeta sp.]MDA3955861.1 hypothetical protein [Oceanispirochaeta sp.]
MVEYSKKVLAELNRLKKIAFKAAQDSELELLYREFGKWKKKRIGSDRMEQIIDGHKGFRKDILEKQYQEDGDPGIPVADALIRGFLKKDDLSEEAYKSIEILVDLVNI